MKTYFLDTMNRYKRFSEKLDAGTILCNKTWLVFNDTGDKEVYIFQEDGSLFISLNGNVTNATWKYITANKSLIVATDKQKVMLHPAFLDNLIFSLQQDGTDNFAFLIDETQKPSTQFKTLSDIDNYLERKIAIEEQERRKEIELIEDRRKQIAAENERQAKLADEKLRNQKLNILIDQQSNLRLEKDRKYIDLKRKSESLLSKVSAYRLTHQLLNVAVFTVFIFYQAFKDDLLKNYYALYLTSIIGGVLLSIYCFYLYKKMEKQDYEVNREIESLRYSYKEKLRKEFENQSHS